MLGLVLSTLLLLTPSEPLVGDVPEWGGFRGNNGTGVASSKSLPDALDVSKNLAWRVEIPAGYSSPTVAGDRVFVTGAVETSLLTMALDRASGAVVWDRSIDYAGGRPGQNSAAAPSPVTDGQHVYSLFHDFGLVAHTVDGDEMWRKPLGPFEIPHGMSTSPLLHEDLVVLLVDQDVGAYLAAYDKLSGEEKWKVERSGTTHSYSTPAVYVPEDGRAQVVVAGSFQITGYALEDGEKLWWVDGSAWQTKSIPQIVGDLCIVNAYMVPSSEFGMPRLTETWEEVLAERDANEDGKLSKSEWDNPTLHMLWFIFDLDGDDELDERDYEYAGASSTATGGLFAIELGGKGNVTESHVRWKVDDRRGLPDCPSPVVYEDTLFLIKEGGLLSAIDPSTGEVIKRDRVAEPDRYFASPVAAAGKLVTASLGGQLSVIRGGRNWEVLSVHDLGEEIWSTPAIAGGQVFVRTQSALYCFSDATQD